MTKRVLLIKMTSMGDLMHALPALTDAAAAIPGIQFDWVADEAFAEIPSWHPAVRTVIKSAHRRWKKNIRSSYSEMSEFYKRLNLDSYDAIVDSQSNLKSAAVALLRRIGSKAGEVYGLDKNSVAEKPAHWLYHHNYFVSRDQHSISHQRQLLAKALGYEVSDTAPDYGIDKRRFSQPSFHLPERYVFLVHNASWATKLWPEDYWHTLIKLAGDAGYSVLLPSGNEEEKQRAERLANRHPMATALPRLSLSEIAAIMDQAQGSICCDTGLGHLAGILNLPSVSLYGPTNAKLIGATGQNQQHLIASTNTYPCSPCHQKTCSFKTTDTSACMESFTPQSVWGLLQTEMTACQGRSE